MNKLLKNAGILKQLTVHAFIKTVMLAVLLIPSFKGITQTTTANDLVKKALEYNTSKQNDIALTYCNQAIALEPYNAWAYNVRGVVYYSLSNYDYAINDYTKAISLNTNYDLPYSNRALIYFNQRKYDLALADYSRALQINPYNTGAYTYRGLIYLNQAQYDLALADYNSVIQINPANADAYAYRGIIYYNQGKYDLALSDYNKVIQLNPQAYLTIANRGLVYYGQGKYDLALNDYSRALQLNPQDYITYINRGLIYYNQANFDLALNDFNKSIDIYPSNANAYADRGLVYFNQAKYDLALMDYNKAIELAPTSYINYSNRGLNYYYQGNYSQAILDFKQALSLDPSQAIIYPNIIITLIHIKNFDDAASYYQQYKSRNLKSYIDGTDWQFYLTLVNAAANYVVKGDYTNALSQVIIAEHQYNEHYAAGTVVKNYIKNAYAEILNLKGYLQVKLDQLAEAKNSYRQSLALNPVQQDISDVLKNLDIEPVIADKTAPEITLISPAPSRSIDIVSDDEKTQIIGRAKDPSGISVVKINGQPVKNVEDDGLFISEINLQNGGNNITIEATDKNGNTATKTFTINTSITTTKVDPAPQVEANQTYYAIIIAEQDYTDKTIPDLTKPISDARELKNILESSYFFDASHIDTMFNRSREDILGDIIARCNTLKENDNLLIFYAGHGIASKNRMGDVDGYLVPVSAQKNNTATYINANDINTAFKNSVAKHILFIADACFSGAFLRSRSLLPDANNGIQKLYNTISRTAMTSGNLEPVPDESKFVFYFKKRLQENTQKYLTARELYNSFYEAILNNTDTTPGYGAIFSVGDEGGDFVFIKK